MKLHFCASAILLWLLFSGDCLAASHSKTHRFDRETWVQGRIDALVRAANAAYEDNDSLPAYEQLLISIARTVRQRNLPQDAAFAARYREFLEYVQTASLDQLPGHELGFTVPDRQYFAETRQFVEIPPILLNPSFLRDVSRYETLERAKSYLRRLNATKKPSERLIFFSYRSRHLGTPDNDDSFLRLLIVAPQSSDTGIGEKWIQFGVTDPNTPRRIRNVSVVTAVPSDDGTFITYFKDYFRSYRRNGSIDIQGRWELGYGDDNCASCHKSGVLPIFPEEGSVEPRELQAVTAVNQRFRGYGSPRFGKYLDQTWFGPGLSSAGWDERTKRFGAGLAGSAVGRAMRCADCHKPEWLGPLNWPMNQNMISSYVRGGQMPFGESLNQSERDDLYDKLIHEYFSTDDANPGILKGWLLGKRR